MLSSIESCQDPSITACINPDCTNTENNQDNCGRCNKQTYDAKECQLAHCHTHNNTCCITKEKRWLPRDIRKETNVCDGEDCRKIENNTDWSVHKKKEDVPLNIYQLKDSQLMIDTHYIIDQTHQSIQNGLVQCKTYCCVVCVLCSCVGLYVYTVCICVH